MPTPDSFRSRALLGAIVLGLVASCAARDEPAAAQDEPSQPPIELRVPALDGGEIDVSRYRGDVVVVHVFAPGEPETAGDVAQLEAAHEANPEGLSIIGVALEPGGYNLAAAWRRGIGVSYLLGLVTGPEELMSAHIEPLFALPTTLVLDAEGRLTHRVDRPLRAGELDALLTELGANVSSERHHSRAR